MDRDVKKTFTPVIRFCLLGISLPFFLKRDNYIYLFRNYT